MFEQEIEMEKRDSSVVPLLLIIALIVAIVGVAGYYIIQNRQVLSMQDAAKIATSSLQGQAPPSLTFHTGMVKSSVADNPQGVHYKLLEKAGLITMGKAQGTYGTTFPVSLTPAGQEFLKRIEGVNTAKEKDGTDLYVVPAAERKLESVSEVKMLSPTRATIRYKWNWKTNALGELLDAAGPTVKGFNSYDRATLIQKYGADFYHGPATEVVLAVMKTDSGVWQVATE